MKEITMKLYQYEELKTEEAKQKALDWYSDVSSSDDWHEYIYEDAREIGIEIENFDLYRGTCNISFKDTAENVANRIIENHGDKTHTYRDAKRYLKAVKTLTDDDQLEQRAEEFESELAEDYRILLVEEFEHINSREYMEEMIIINEYDFDEFGHRYSVVIK